MALSLTGHQGQWLWLRFENGLLAALRLTAYAQFSATAWTCLTDVLAQDGGQNRLEVVLPDIGPASLLHAAPPSPLNVAMAQPSAPGPSQALTPIRAFAEGLDTSLLEFLQSLNGGRVYDSVRNYNRLAGLDVARRRNRMQAIQQYSPLLAHVFLTPHHDHDYQGGSAHRWRMHDDGIVTSVDTGKALLPELSRRFGTQKSVFKSPLMIQRWPDLELARQELLWLLDGIPAHVRPRDLSELEAVKPVLAWLKFQGQTQQDVLQKFGAEFFSMGLASAMQRLQDRYGGRALEDMADFLDALDKEWENHGGPVTDPRSGSNGQNALSAWLRHFGPWRLLDASARWHTWIHSDWQAQGQSWPPLVGRLVIEDWHCVELTSTEDLTTEGRVMRHCVATRWVDCLMDGTRIFALTGPSGERATAQCDLDPSPAGGQLLYSLRELRGPDNTEASLDCERIAFELAIELCKPVYDARRQAIAEGLSTARTQNFQTRPHLDPTSLKMVSTLLRTLGRYEIKA